MRPASLTYVIVLVAATSALDMACVVRAEVAGPAEAPPPPPQESPPPPEAPPPPIVFVQPPVLVTIEPGIWVVQDSDYPVYQVDNYYWVYRGDVWYRSQSYSGGWAVAEVSIVPPTIVHRDQRLYVHYRGPPNAVTRQAPIEHPRAETSRPVAGPRPEVDRNAPVRASSPSAVTVRDEQARSPVERVQEPAKKPEDDSRASERAVNARPVTPAPAPAPRPSPKIEAKRLPPPPPPAKREQPKH
jgi:hypothetical protein